MIDFMIFEFSKCLHTLMMPGHFYLSDLVTNVLIQVLLGFVRVTEVPIFQTEITIRPTETIPGKAIRMVRFLV